MKLFSANIEDLQGLYITELKKSLGMERKLVQILPLMIDSCSDPSLCAAFRRHLEETRGHVTKLEGVLRRLIGESVTENCKVITELIAVASNTVRGVRDPLVRDMALVAVARRIEHHEMVQYAILRQWAELLDMHPDARVLGQIESEEMAADQLLVDLSTRVHMEVAAA